MTSETKVRVVRSSSVDISQHRVVTECDSREAAERYIREHSVDEHGNVSDEPECDYLRIEGDE